MRRRFELAGWVTFLVCALAFIALGVRERDGLAIAAALLFLAGCVLFLVPFFSKRQD